MTAPGVQEPDYDTLVAELVAFRVDRLQGKLSNRTLAEAAGVSPTTIGNWLNLQERPFPQKIDPLLNLLRAIRTYAESARLADDPAAGALLDAQRWRRAYKAKARQNADGTRAAVVAEHGQTVLERMRPGQPLPLVTDPFHLEVHHAIDSQTAGLPVLPEYVPREHDRLLGEVVERAADDQDRFRFGREPDGSAAGPWTWEDLE
ncbi:MULTISPECIES: helix-turn-helix domain-containing protein [Streptomyces]|uniref:XRE family transcriptional regulator n=1 Tax=Streptomyces dengpaensis TaxID=2049881 RepID=A0ABN5HU74_9ACTN|nr:MULTISPECIES: hypothetical protein [Streptomyces]AVH54636.1 hypothetical protein C4B68_00975 [Streptomyces dengpaensis]PIB05190.1 hypothetical protein B1C81_30220 [Streptomyces sp. HG99]